MKRSMAVTLCAPVLFAMLANAGEIINAGTGLAIAQNTITFSEVPLTQGAVVTNQYASFGATFSGAYYDPQPGFFADPSIGNFSFCCGTESNPVSIFFGGPTTDAAFQFITNDSPPDSTFSAYLAGSLVASFTAPTGLDASWFGFTGLTFDEIQVSGGGPGNFFLVDNLEFSASSSAIPEPATSGLLGAALIGLYTLRRKRK